MSQETDRFYKAYLEGDANQARWNLDQLIQLFESQKAGILGQSGRASSLFVSYARLYVLEKRVGSSDSAEAALIRARYWDLESYESSDDGWKNRVSPGEFLSHITPEKITEMVDKLDENSNKGRGPKYGQ